MRTVEELEELVTKLERGEIDYDEALSPKWFATDEDYSTHDLYMPLGDWMYSIHIGDASFEGDRWVNVHTRIIRWISEHRTPLAVTFSRDKNNGPVIHVRRRPEDWK